MWRCVLAFLVISSLGAGCLGADGTASKDQGPASPADAAATIDGEGPTSQEDAPFTLDAPVLPVGRSWTFSTSGVYDTGAEQTAVVAQAGPGGYLIAGASEADLVEAASWDVPWMGEYDLDLSPVSDDARPADRSLYDFPLVDGKEWSWGEGTAIAREADIQTPNNGTERGFVITASSNGWIAEWTYAPSVGFFTTYRAGTAEAAYVEGTLTAVGTSDQWTWFEPGPTGYACGDPVTAEAFEVTEDLDAVILSAGSSGGGWARAASPPPDLTTFEFEGADSETWHYALEPATPGQWTLSAGIEADAPEGSYACVFAFTATWDGPNPIG